MCEEGCQHNEPLRVPQAGPPCLCDVPEELLYCIMRHLTPCDQQNVFLTCRQLYKARNIQLRDSDHMLKLLTLGLQCLESRYTHSGVNTGSPNHYAELICVFREEGYMEDIKAEAGTAQCFRFSCRQFARDVYTKYKMRQILDWPAMTVGDRMESQYWLGQSTCWKAQTSSQILHRLTASTDSAGVRLTLSSSNTISRNKVQELAHLWLSYLTSNSGHLVVILEKSCEYYIPDAERYGQLRVGHYGSEWTINENSHKTAPASLDLEHLPCGFCGTAIQCSLNLIA